METEARLTRLASCAGCGAKVGAGTLSSLLEDFKTHTDPRLIVGFDKSDDASVYVINDETALIQTVDFFPTCSVRSRPPMLFRIFMPWAGNPAWL